MNKAVSADAWIQDPADVTKLLQNCNENILEIVFVLVNTGMRLDECLHLHWTDLDLKTGHITIQRGRKGPTKSGKERTIGIDPGLVARLKAMKVENGGKTELVFPGTSRGADGKLRPRDKSGVFTSFKRALARAGLSSKLKLHSLRHTHASNWVSANHSIYSLSKRLGHSSIAVTEKIYAHLRPGTDTEAIAATAVAMPAPAKLGKVIAFSAG